MPVILCPVCGDIVLAQAFPIHMLFVHFTCLLRDAIASVTRRGKFMRTVHGTLEDDCPVCLSGLSTGPCVRLTSCHHMFHRKCIERWWKCDDVAATCPTCRLAYDATI